MLSTTKMGWTQNAATQLTDENSDIQAVALSDINTGGQLPDLVARQKHAPDDKEITRQIEALVDQALPETITQDLLDALPVDCTTKKNGLGTLVIPKPYLPTRSAEPEHGWIFTKVCYLYLPSGVQGSQLRLFCIIHYTRPADADLAARAALLLSITHKTLVQRFARPAANGDAPFHVWLCREGKTGGEQFRENLYFYDLDTPRSSIEWVREIVHEYAHLAVPAIGGYQSPEYWANGYLGERLLIRWLYRNSAARTMVEREWGDFSGAPNFMRLLVDPACALYRKVGPNAHWLRRKDADGMRYFIGLVLIADDKYGAPAIGGAMAELPRFQEATPMDFVEALSKAVALRNRPHGRSRHAAVLGMYKESR